MAEERKRINIKLSWIFSVPFINDQLPDHDGKFRGETTMEVMIGKFRDGDSIMELDETSNINGMVESMGGEITEQMVIILKKIKDLGGLDYTGITDLDEFGYPV